MYPRNNENLEISAEIQSKSKARKAARFSAAELEELLQSSEQTPYERENLETAYSNAYDLWVRYNMRFF